MIKIIFAFITVIHSLIHLLGFFKAFELAKIEQLTQNISKTLGLIWLLISILFLISIVLFFLKKDYWFFFSFISIILSQILIISCWQDAKFGTVANIIILIPTILGYGTFTSNNMVNNELKLLSSNYKTTSKILSEKDITNLPPLIKKWLKNSNIIGKKEITHLTLNQTGEMITNPDSKNWMKVNAKQWFKTNEPSFIWIADVNAGFGIHLFGRDKFIDGEGNMLIKILSLYSIVNAKSKEINQGTMIRYLAEMIWFPSFAISPYINWEQVSDSRVKVIMNYKGNEVFGFYNFNKDGNITSFEAKRFYENNGKSTLEDWVINIDTKSIKEFQEIKIPTKSTVTWKLKNGDFTWYKLEISDVKYN